MCKNKCTRCNDAGWTIDKTIEYIWELGDPYREPIKNPGTRMKLCDCQAAVPLLSPATETPLYVADPTSGAVKGDYGKLRFDLVPVYALEEITRVFSYGSVKYTDRNWESGLSWSRPFAACMRHMWAWWRGEDLDPESKISHLAHAACNIMFLLDYSKYKQSFDDRPKES